MKLLHTKLPDFIKKMQAAAAGSGEIPKEIEISGVENLKTALVASAQTGRIETAVSDVASVKEITRLELHMIPRIPEIGDTVIVKGYDKDGICQKVVLEMVTLLHPMEETYLLDCEDVKIEDRRRAIGHV